MRLGAVLQVIRQVFVGVGLRQFLAQQRVGVLDVGGAEGELIGCQGLRVGGEFSEGCVEILSLLLDQVGNGAWLGLDLGLCSFRKDALVNVAQALEESRIVDILLNFVQYLLVPIEEAVKLHGLHGIIRHLHVVVDYPQDQLQPDPHVVAHVERSDVVSDAPPARLHAKQLLNSCGELGQPSWSVSGQVTLAEMDDKANTLGAIGQLLLVAFVVEDQVGDVLVEAGLELDQELKVPDENLLHLVADGIS